jgi:hypothetical protein
MSLEKNFQRESSEFLFVSEALLGFLYGVLGSVTGVLACASMLFSVKFHVGMRDVWMLQEMRIWMSGRLCGEGNLKRRRHFFSYTIFYYVILSSCLR